MFQLNTKNLLRTIHVLLILTVCILSVTLAVKNNKKVNKDTFKGTPLKSVQNKAVQKSTQNKAVQKSTQNKAVQISTQNKAVEKGAINSYGSHSRLVKTFPKGGQIFKTIVETKVGYKGEDAGKIRERTRTFSYKDTENFAQTHNKGQNKLTNNERSAAHKSIEGWRANGKKTDGVKTTMYKGTNEGIRLDYQKDQGMDHIGVKEHLYANYQLQFNNKGPFSKRTNGKLPTSLAQVNLPIRMAQKYPDTVGTALSLSVDSGKIVQISQTKQVLRPQQRVNDKQRHG